MSSQTIHFGLLLLPDHQWLDAAGPVDYINNHSIAFMRLIVRDEAILAKCPTIVWHYISSDLKPIQATSGPLQYPSCTYDDCPEIEYLIVPGPDPTKPLPEGCGDFLHKLMAKDSFKALLTVCTGSLIIAQSGILDGYNVCSNKYTLKLLSEMGMLYTKVKWVADKRWHVDGKVWSAAGITSGIDLAAEFSRVHFDREVVEIVKDVSECTPIAAHPDAFARILEGVKLS